MTFDSSARPHWTDEQLIASLYGVGPENGHLHECEECKSRRSLLLGNRNASEVAASTEGDVSFEFLARQRRAICENLDARSAWRTTSGLRRWVPVMLTLLILGGGAAVYQERHARQLAASQVSDAQLALEVSRMSQEWQAQPAEPLQGLFE